MTLNQIFPHTEQNIPIMHITNDSRDIQPHTLFIAYTGFEIDLHQYIPNAFVNGCRMFLVDSTRVEEFISQFPEAIFIGVENLLEESARIIWAFHRYPDRDLKIIAITGTNGKTTTATIIDQSLRAMGRKTAFFGTVEWRVEEEVLPSLNTTPDLLTLVCLLDKARNEGVEFVIMEAASHAMSLGRIQGLNIDVAGFTNLTQDHLDFHKDFESYFRAKTQLFINNLTNSYKSNRRAFVNADDEYGQRLLRLLGEIGVPSESLSTKNIGTWNAKNIRISMDKNTYELSYRNEKNIMIDNPLLGLINVQNTMMAYTILEHFGFDPKDINQSFENVSIDGRLQKFWTGKKVLFLVDYAHTPDAIEKSLDVARSLLGKKNRLFIVFGAGGDRDKTKRPLMAQASERADAIIVTSDNPRTEDPQMIIDDICTGFSEGKEFYAEIDRAKAIRFAYELANAGDIVLVAGKGHEEYQIVGREKTFYSDKREISQL